MKSRRGAATSWAMIAAWAIAAFGGTVGMAAYQFAPGDAATAPSAWPLANRAHLDTTRPTIVMSLHPLCACSRASVGELARLMTTVGDRAHALVLLVIPEGFDASVLDRSDLVAQARLVRNTEIVVDPRGAISSRFDAHTSGQTFLYDTAGRLVFAGGLTSGRGHMGDSPGRDRILTYLVSRSADLATSPVFGCGLEDPEPRTSN